MLDLAGKPHIMPLLKIINRPSDTVLVFPYVPGRDLFRFMRAHKNPKGHLSEYETHIILRQLLSALKTCHDKRIIHRDIKPENIMIDEQLNIFLGDFGLAVKLQDYHNATHKGRAGTPCYYPYEMVNNMEYDYRADVWCLGVLLVEMLFGVLPFKCQTGSKDYSAAITALKFTLPANKPSLKVSNHARELIKHMLVP